MFRILIVEDFVELSSDLKKLFGVRLPDAQVDSAFNVAEGKHKLEEARSQKRLYDAVVLDFNLPASLGENPEIDESLCNQIGYLMPDAVVAHLSGYMTDGRVEEHMKNAHDRQVNRSLRFSKADVDYPDQLVGGVRKYLYGGRVEEKLDRLFGRSSSMKESNEDIDEVVELSFRNRRDRLRGSSEGSLTHEVASLQREIAAHWLDFDAKLQAKIEKRFEVTKQLDRLIVTLR